METEVRNITDMIIEEARKDAASIIEEAKNQGEDLIESKKREAIQLAEREAARFQYRLDEAKLVREKIISDAELQAQWRVLAEKQGLVENVFDSLKNELDGYVKSPEYDRMLRDLIVAAGIVLKGDGLFVTLNEEDASRINLDELAEIISEKTNVPTTLTPSGERHDDYGVIVKTGDGKIVIDNTLRAILKRLDRDLRFKAVQILFK